MGVSKLACVGTQLRVVSDTTVDAVVASAIQTGFTAEGTAVGANYTF